MLEVHEVTAAYGDLTALWGMSFEVRQGEVVALIGPNGAGKSTMMRVMAGLHSPSSGSIALDGRSVEGEPAHRMVEAGVILVPEGRRLFGAMSVLDNLEMGAYSGRARSSRLHGLRRVFETFPILAERRFQIAATLSGGEQQMLAVGRALMGQPRLLLLDEPSLGLAPLVVQQIFSVLRSVREQGITVVLVEQNAALALELADRAYVVEQGRVVGSGTGAELLADEGVRQAYLGLAPTPSAL